MTLKEYDSNRKEKKKKTPPPPPPPKTNWSTAELDPKGLLGS